MFTPNQTGLFQHRTGRNLDGEEIYGAAKLLQLSVVRLDVKSEKTAVRTDSSATHGNADQTVADAVILTNEAELVVDDLVEFNGANLRVIGIHPRYTAFGSFDHFQVSLEYVAV